jgi:tetratricopeptide (TPR) repeat protein
MAMLQQLVLKGLISRGKELQNSNPAKAVPYFEEALRRDSSAVDAFIGAGICYLHLAQGERAVDVLAKATLTIKDSSTIYFLLGEAHALIGNLRDACVAYRTAIDHEETHYPAHYQLGVCYLGLKQRIEAHRQLLLLEAIKNESQWGDRTESMKSLIDFTGKPSKKHRPFDDAKIVPKFADFRDKLLKAVKQRDSKFLLNSYLPVARYESVDAAINDFKEMWRPERKDSRVWAALEHALSLGGSWANRGGLTDDLPKGRYFIAPYFPFRFPYKGSEYAVYGVAKNLRSSVYKAPNLQSEIVERLNFDCIRILTYSDLGSLISSYTKQKSLFQIAGRFSNLESADSWYRVVTASGSVGYMAGFDLSESVSTSLAFSQVNGHWKLRDVGHIGILGGADDC